MVTDDSARRDALLLANRTYAALMAESMVGSSVAVWGYVYAVTSGRRRGVDRA
jgi:hypothetical protein